MVQLGEVFRMSLNQKGDMLALYCNHLVKGTILVCESNLNSVLNVLDTYQLNAQDLTWCGNDLPVMTQDKTLILIGPESTEKIEF
jgi:hypothetical protein